MQVCEGKKKVKEYKHPVVKGGDIVRLYEYMGRKETEYYLVSSIDRLINIQYGGTWSSSSLFGEWDNGKFEVVDACLTINS